MPREVAPVSWTHSFRTFVRFESLPNESNDVGEVLRLFYRHLNISVSPPSEVDHISAQSSGIINRSAHSARINLPMSSFCECRRSMSPRRATTRSANCPYRSAVDTATVCFAARAWSRIARSRGSGSPERCYARNRPSGLDATSSIRASCCASFFAFRRAPPPRRQSEISAFARPFGARPIRSVLAASSYILCT
jgi:hypothetical protein